MVILNSPCPLNSRFHSLLSSSASYGTLSTTTAPLISAHRHCQLPPLISSQLYNHRQTPSPSAAPARQGIDKSLLDVSEAHSDSELWAAACLRARSFYDFPEQSFGIQDHKKYLAEREFEALKERIAGTRVGFKRVSCINATLPLSQLANISDELCSFCKLSNEGESRVVVGTLDLNQCIRLPEEITGMKPKGIGADFARAYISNVCVAKELQRNGLGYALIAKSKMVAEEWGNNILFPIPFSFQSSPWLLYSELRRSVQSVPSFPQPIYSNGMVTVLRKLFAIKIESISY